MVREPVLFLLAIAASSSIKLKEMGPDSDRSVPLAAWLGFLSLLTSFSRVKASASDSLGMPIKDNAEIPGCTQGRSGHLLPQDDVAKAFLVAEWLGVSNPR